MKRIALSILGLLLLASVPAAAQTPQLVRQCFGNPCNPVTASNPLPVDATVNASISGFTPAAVGTPIVADTNAETGSLPAGEVVVAMNVGTTNTAYCMLGAAATTASIAIPPQSWFGFTVGAATQLTCITSTSTTTVNMIGGEGLPTGAGGGGSAGGGGGGTSSEFGQAFPANGTAIGVSDGTNMIALRSGTAGTAAPTVLTVQGVASMTPVQVSQATAGNLNATVVGTGTFAVQAAQSGTWNITNVSGTVSLPTGASTAAKQPALGTAGTASSDVITVQGIASMTPLLANPGTAANWGIGATASAVPANAVRVGLNIGGNLQGATGILVGSHNAQTVAVVNSAGSQLSTFPVSAASGSIASGALASGSVASGAMVDLGAQADSTCGTATGTCSLISLLKYLNSQQASSIPAGTNLIGSVNVLPTTAGGLSTYFVQPTAGDNAANIKNGAGQVYKVSVTNNQATINYLRLYDAGSGFAGCNSATNLKYQMAIPGSTSGAGYSDSWDMGMAFSTGISICVTSGYATNSTTAATASAMSVNVGYK